VAEEIIKQQLPEVLLQAVDFDTLKQAPSEFISEKFQQKQADLIFSAELIKGNRAYFYFLCEHQSQSEPLMAFTLLSYTLEIMKHHLTQHPGLPLPIVYPIVLYAN